MNEEIFDVSFENFRKTKLKHFQINNLSDENSASNTASALKELKSIVADQHNKYLNIDMDIFYNALSYEANGFYKRVEKQKENVMKMNDDFDYTWNYVSEYYLSFFAITALTRFNGKYTIYLQGKDAKEISTIASTYEKEMLQINQGQYVLEILEHDYFNREVKVKMSKKKDTHASAWELFFEFLTSYKKLSEKTDSAENNILSVLEQFFTRKKNILSECRNDLNYKYHFGFEDIDKYAVYGMYNWETDVSFLQSEILKLQNNPNNTDCIESIVLINFYLVNLLNKIYSTYSSRDAIRS